MKYNKTPIHTIIVITFIKSIKTIQISVTRISKAFLFMGKKKRFAQRYNDKQEQNLWKHARHLQCQSGGHHLQQRWIIGSKDQ